MASEMLERLADLAVEFGANVQRGQIVAINATPDDEELVHLIAERAYRRGARYVDPFYFDPEVKRLRIAHAEEDTLSFVPPWYAERLRALGRERSALISIVPRVLPGLLADLDSRRAGKDLLPALKESVEVINERTLNWTAVPHPTGEWARLVHRDLDREAALTRLWDEIGRVCRLDEADPAVSWRSRTGELEAIAERLTGRRFDALHFGGDGTDLTVGLLPTSTWGTAWFSTRDGVQHMVNIPSEEVFTAPDPERVDGVVKATKPLDLAGTLVEGLTVRFEAGWAVAISAERGAEALRQRCARDEGATRLGEVALVDRHGRVGQLGTVFCDTLLDENAASHLALGAAYAHTVEAEDRDRINRSEIHVDFMIGGDHVAVTGVTREGERVPVLHGGDWAI